MFHLDSPLGNVDKAAFWIPIRSARIFFRLR